MTREEAEEYAKGMTFHDAVYNALQGKCIPYRKATFIKLYELLDMVEPQASPTGEDSTCDSCKTPCVMYEKGMRGCKGVEVLDKIRAEIENIKVIRDEYSQRQNDYCDGVEFAKKICLQIIDKYKAESEGIRNDV